MRTTAELNAVILEAEQIRARHDGVHAIHSYVAVLQLCRDFATEGAWAPYVDSMFDEAMAKIRIIDRTGFAPRSSAQYTAPRVARSQTAFSVA